MYRCVKIKVEIGRQWGKTSDKFKWVVFFAPPRPYDPDADPGKSRLPSSQAMKQLKQLSGVPDSPVTSSSASAKDKKRVNITECCICEWMFPHCAPTEGFGLNSGTAC